MQVLATHMVCQLQWEKFCWTDCLPLWPLLAAALSILIDALKLNYSKQMNHYSDLVQRYFHANLYGRKENRKKCYILKQLFQNINIKNTGLSFLSSNPFFFLIWTKLQVKYDTSKCVWGGLLILLCNKSFTCCDRVDNPNSLTKGRVFKGQFQHCLEILAFWQCKVLYGGPQTAFTVVAKQWCWW